jgi:zinc dependent phospholipase C
MKFPRWEGLRMHRRGLGTGWRSRVCIFYLILATVLLPIEARSYSVLAHEALIDVTWETHFRPLLLKRFPNATEEQLRQAHGYAYGGAIIQDLGYYPRGEQLFSDLVHYVRSGDFIIALLRDAQDLNEYAFALGTLSHYAADNDGHRIAVNAAVPLLYPKLRRKFASDILTYEDDPAAHLKTEFAFDVIEIAKGRYAPNSYHDFIGFYVAQDLLRRAFVDTYSVPLRSVFGDLDRAVSSYRHTVSSTIPRATRVAWELKKDDIERDLPGMTRKKFLYNLSRASYEKEWGNDYQRPGIRSKLLAFLIRIAPKVGPLKVLAFHAPTPEVEQMFMESFNAAADEYRRLLGQVSNQTLHLPNVNFDTGGPTRPGEYRMETEAYATLLAKLTGPNAHGVSPELRADIVNYFRGLSLPDPSSGKRAGVNWEQVPDELATLQNEARAVQTPALRSRGSMPETKPDP